ncbi:methyltransferase family protein [Ponticoccus alexandrii]|uniref:Isoprenylcysteine carboxylmethyltransferase family protein n=1 Tax=Ponticoccus alexandrii TaxID=1943633 RepID=A0ABX7F6F1_9RHOB|nr:isoprenylcysteine carboxylmethyltransferase family protein [Ponticoccus alexandrii]ETA53804.1 S-isoprenylcysteine methyltransferase [Rhodobacteraceae bacterium PD-2]QRF66108.1 isoprenylcysteine carboxylmethyltransferase family protein [Ponticoccus alexandrii]
MKWLDMPPVWLASFLAVAWCQKTYYPVGSFGPIWADLLGGLLVGGGLLLLPLAVTEMRRQRTTVIPHREADRLVTTGIFSRSRNPIYLGDSMILAGMILYWDAVLALPLIPIFVWVVERRFIAQEEMWLRRKFVTQYTRYAQQTRRWL